MRRPSGRTTLTEPPRRMVSNRAGALVSMNIERGHDMVACSSANDPMDACTAQQSAALVCGLPHRWCSVSEAVAEKCVSRATPRKTRQTQRPEKFCCCHDRIDWKNVGSASVTGPDAGQRICGAFYIFDTLAIAFERTSPVGSRTLKPFIGTSDFSLIG